MDKNTEFTIIIKNETTDSGGADEAIAESSTKSPKKEAEERRGLLSKESAKKFGAFVVAYNQVKGFVLQDIDYKVSLVQLRTGSNRLQEKANFTNRLIQQGVGIMEMTAQGALVGGLAGAVAGLTLSTAHTVIGYAQNANRLSLQKSVENESLEMQFIRAGARGSRVE